MEPRDLVCARCWRDFFDTKDYEQCCAGAISSIVGIEVTSTIDEVRNAAQLGCNWCDYINSFIKTSENGESKITVTLCPTSIESCTPEGRNTFYISISRRSPAGELESASSLFLHAFTTAENEAGRYVTARPIQTDVGSAAAHRQIKTWLRECEEHECCSSPHTASMLPTRVIEVSPPGQKDPRLVESEGIQGVYATLSYCWGTVPFPNLTISNRTQFKEGLDMSTLPLTIRNAIATTREMSIPYIWIDALCIMQDSEEDKMREISRMKGIFASSTVTIVAASSKSVFDGFLYDRDNSETVYRIPARVDKGVFGAMFVNELDAATYDERSEPIAKRAWTMQEQVLAQRTVIFATHTMLWNCKASARNFGDSLYFPYDLDSGFNDDDEKYSLNLNSLLITEHEARSNKNKALSCWLRLVTAFSLRKASHENDKLNSLAGIASHPSFSSLGPNYFAGIWEYKLAIQLMWYTSDWHRTLGEDEKFTFYRPTTYRAPSWSWASLEGGVIHFDFSFDDEDEPEPEIVCEVVECSTTAKFPDLNPLGEVLYAQLTLRGSLRMAWFNPKTSNVILLHDPIPDDHDRLDKVVEPYEEAWKRHVVEFKARHPDIDIEEDPEAVNGTDYDNTNGRSDESGFTQLVVVFCLPVTLQSSSLDGTMGLLLTSCKHEGRTSYKRIGIFKRGMNKEFEDLPRRDICII
ncbi:HET-domain-containing protein [Hypoxylon trugodes]|uniref:HET-domain-containing protein n=1 Tax=Hypoxylon trugodes TaxID=326681 RepID=UPI0021A1864E|nr:HET-domain-containing protein [Hypoxylon trugodes]KAI1391540.1 HET-domain-containing protein [Hypoxylon trugodes]